MHSSAKEPYYIFSPFLRIFHWVMVLMVLILFVTGLYIGNPTYIGTLGLEPTYAVDVWYSMERIRFLHFACAYIFVASLMLRVYGFIINKGDRLFPRPWTFDYWIGTIEVALHYMFVFPTHRHYLRNHMARAGYASVYVMLLVEVITGFAMYYMINPNGLGALLFGSFNHWLVNEYTVHIIHRYIAWFIILFSIVHVYMTIRSDATDKNGEISSMFSGVKYLHEEPADIGDIK